MKTSVGVVIGRFQCHRLTEGHLALLSRANGHSKLLICIGISKVIGTPYDPLDYQTREQMIREVFPRAVVMPLPDQPSNEVWTKSLNQMIGTLFPTDQATIYCGRANAAKSLQDGYQGPHKVVEIDEIPHISATDLRAQVSRSVEASEAFRRGVIFGATNQFSRSDLAVDICCFREVGDEKEILLGSRNAERGKLRLPGGHVDPTDDHCEAAARRELSEETGVEASDYEILDAVRVQSRDAPGYAMFTVLYLAKYTFGPAKGADDLDECKWVNIKDLDKYQYADDHKVLVAIALSTLQEI